MISSRQAGYPQQFSVLRFLDNPEAPTLSPGDPDIYRVGTVTYYRDGDGNVYPLIDTAASGYTWNPRAATATNTTLSGPQTVDGISAVAGDLVWLFGQSTGTQNGPWFVRAGAWERPALLVAPGQLVQVGAGTNWGGITFQVVGYGTVGYDAQTVQINTGIKVGPKSERQGTVTLVAGVGAVTNVSLDATSVIMLTRKTAAGTAIGDLAAPAADRVNGILTGGFTVRSYKDDATAETADVSTVDWLIVS
ncbi:MAG: hypothetical protein E6Q97_36375 [Desulfurellales bacterium]|nr:MAG: hypothetical protein E6Q97_36375 [Desulfurellales bacterium]